MTLRGNHPDELISASLTGDLTDAERTELDAHLARCQRCRATLAAFKAERRILSGLPVADPPRDLSARVRSGIESGRLGAPWWRGPRGVIALVASAGTVAVAVLAIVVLGNRPFGPVGQESGSPQATLSSEPSSSAVETTEPSVAPPTPPVFALGSGELGYLSLSGAPFEPSRLTFINDATGDSIDLGTVSGPPIAASLSPDGQRLAYIIQKGETGANEVWVASLVSGERTLAGCSLAVPFGERLTWSPRGDLLAFTVSAIDLGGSGGCPKPNDPDGTTRPWLFSVFDLAAAPLMEAGKDSYAASFVPFAVPGAANRLWVSHAGETPSSELMAVAWPAASFETLATADGIFLPLISPDGNRALFWSGTMVNAGGTWQFSRGGMPQLSGDFRSAGPASPWIGTPLFNDLTPIGGEAFASGSFTWGPDSDLVAFWDGAWTGAPQSADGSYPNQQDVYLGRVSAGLFSATSRLDFSDFVTDGSWIVDVALTGLQGNYEAAVTIGLPPAGIGDPPSAYLVRSTNASVGVGGEVEPSPWQGPAVYGY